MLARLIGVAPLELLDGQPLLEISRAAPEQLLPLTRAACSDILGRVGVQWHGVGPGPG